MFEIWLLLPYVFNKSWLWGKANGCGSHVCLGDVLVLRRRPPTCRCPRPRPRRRSCSTPCGSPSSTTRAPSRPAPSLPTKLIPIKIAQLKLSRKLPMDMRIPPLKGKILLESNPLKSRTLVRRLAVQGGVTHLPICPLRPSPCASCFGLF